MASTNLVPRLIDLVKPTRHGSTTASFLRKSMESICRENKLLSIYNESTKSVSRVGGDKAYVLIGSLAQLERALTRWTMNELVTKHRFTPVVVPNIIYDHIIEKCGFPTKSKRSQIYKISGSNEDNVTNLETQLLKSNETITHSCIAGTSEFALVSTHIGDSIPNEELPKRYCALSRCYRAEAPKTANESGLYRVHYFNKVEMVGLTMPDKSYGMLEEFLQIQRDLFSQLGLQYKILDMPEDDLGASAKKKYDIEAWMEGRQLYGEISSASNCEDYQSSRLNIKYTKMVERNNQLQVDSDYVHTLNGTACSTVRTLIALIEQHQTEDDRVEIPEPLVAYMGGHKTIPTPADEKLLAKINLYPE